MKIIYLMHVNWRWIKQRPQFLAEALSRHFQVSILFPRAFFSKSLLTNEKASPKTNKLKVRPYFRLPFDRFAIIREINAVILNIFYIRFSKAEIIWIPSPMQYRHYKKKAAQLLVYDCMDDMLEINKRNSISNCIRKNEKELLTDADFVFCSSENLKKTLIERYNLSRSIYVINNAISLDNKIKEHIGINNDIKQKFNKNSNKKFVYIGTISNWMNFELILCALDKFYNLEFVFFGPCETSVPAHSRITYYGIVDHTFVHDIMQHADALIMPFVVNELIKSVNPVKAYEYISAYKPVIMPRYKESEKFTDYISLYDNETEFLAIIKMILSDNYEIKLSKKEHLDYTTNNTWDKRATEIRDIILSSYR